MIPPPRISVLIPCYNEKVAIAAVMHDFRGALPEATVLRVRQQFLRPHPSRLPGERAQSRAAAG